MYSPHKFEGRVGRIGSALPDPYPVFNNPALKVKFRRGAVSMIAGIPGSFKSVLALNMLTRWAKDHGQFCYYFCADSDEYTVIKRLSAILSGMTVENVERELNSGQKGKYHDYLTKLDNRAQFEYESMDFENIVRRVKSYEAVFGGYPDAIFIDNLTDFVSNPMAFDEMHELLAKFDALAKEVKAHICVLHHAKLGDKEKREEQQAGAPPADWEIQGKLTQKPRLVLTIAALSRVSCSEVNFAVVKNSMGPQDRNAENYNTFTVHDDMQIKDRE